MSLLVPAALGLASLAGPLLVLYMLRSRRRRVEVSSTLLWSRLDEPVTSAVPWRRLRLTPLLLLQLGVLALFVLSLARPFFTQATLLGPHTVMVVDTSGSMAAAGRLERAKQRAIELAADVSPANLVSVVEAGPDPQVVAAFSRSPGTVREAVSSLQPTGGRADLSGAIRLARGLATPDRPTNLVLLTDGGEGPLPEEPVLDARHLPFDETAENLTIAAFSAEPSGEGALRAFVSVANHGSRDREVALELSVEGLPSGSVDLEVPAGGEAGLVVPLDAGPGEVVQVRRVGPPDGLVLDDAAWLVLGAGPVRTVEVRGAGSPFLQALLAATPGFALAEEEADGDLLVVDGGSFPDLDRPAWVMRTEPPPDGMDVQELVRNVAATHQRPGDPILDSVDLSQLAVAEAQVVETVSWLPLVRAGDVPLVLLGEVGGHRVVYFTFDITHSNLPLQVGFPILGSRLLEWLGGAGGGAVSAGVAGDPIPLSAPPGAGVQVGLPDGSTRVVDPRSASFRDTGMPGVYRVSYRGEDGSLVPGPVAVRAFAAEEGAAGSRRVAVAPGGAAEPEESGLVREWAPLVVTATLLLLLLEWWVAHQRPMPRWRSRPA